MRAILNVFILIGFLFVSSNLFSQNVIVATYSNIHKSYYAIVEGMGLIKVDQNNKITTLLPDKKVLIKEREVFENYIKVVKRDSMSICDFRNAPKSSAKVQLFVDKNENIWFVDLYGWYSCWIDHKNRQLVDFVVKKDPDTFVPNIEQEVIMFDGINDKFHHIYFDGEPSAENIVIEKYKNVSDRLFRIAEERDKTVWVDRLIEEEIEKANMSPQTLEKLKNHGKVNMADITVYKNQWGDLSKGGYIIATTNGLFHYNGTMQYINLQSNADLAQCEQARNKIKPYYSYLSMTKKATDAEKVKVFAELDQLRASCSALDEANTIKGWIAFQRNEWTEALDIFGATKETPYNAYVRYVVDSKRSQDLNDYWFKRFFEITKNDTACEVMIYMYGDRMTREGFTYPSNAERYYEHTVQAIEKGVTTPSAYALKGMWKYASLSEADRPNKTYCEDIKKSIELHRAGQESPVNVMFGNYTMRNDFRNLLTTCDCDFEDNAITAMDLMDAIENDDTPTLESKYEKAVDYYGIENLKRANWYGIYNSKDVAYRRKAYLEAYGMIHIESDDNNVWHDLDYMQWLRVNGNENGNAFEKACWYLYKWKQKENNVSSSINLLRAPVDDGYHVETRDVTRFKDVRETESSGSEIDGSVTTITTDKKVSETTSTKVLVKNDDGSDRVQLQNDIDRLQGELKDMEEYRKNYIPIPYEGF